MAQNSEWGPPLWLILHMSVEKCGKQPIQMLHMDEIRALIHLLEITETILPCPMCQSHYRKWIKSHPLKSFLDMKSPVRFYDGARSWLWRLHDSINAERGATRICVEEANAIYATKTSEDFQQALKKLLEILDKAKLQRLIDGAFIREWVKKLTMLRRFIYI